MPLSHVENLEDCTVLIVDDSPDNLAFMAQGLVDRYHIKAAKSGMMALNILKQFSVDLILLDIVMPEMSGYDVIRHVKSNPETQHIPVMFLTGKDSLENEKLGFELGAADYLHKPISIPLLRSRVQTHLQNKRSKDILKDQNGFLEREVIKRSKELDRMQDAVVFALASLAETRDPETGRHILRTQHYVKLLAEHMATMPKYKDLLTPQAIDTLFKAAPLHDIGKVGIADSILLKQGKLTTTEFEIMKNHTTLGYKALERAEQLSGTKNELISVAKEIACYHHEKWNGMGYPNGLSKAEIPLSARLMAVADVYDALRCRRIYKDPVSHEEAKIIILTGSGEHFDPDVIDAFLKQEMMFIQIANLYGDEG